MSGFDTAKLEPRAVGRIVKSAVAPRPIAWISTRGTDGVDNLAPFSSYTYVSSSRPVVLFNTTVGEAGELKDSARNAIDTEEFVVNVVTESLIKRMDRTSERVSADVSEFDLAGVERADCVRVAPPRVADAVVSLECTLYDTMRVHDKQMVLGEVVFSHVAERVLTDGEIDMRKIDAVGRLGGPYYTGVEVLEFERGF